MNTAAGFTGEAAAGLAGDAQTQPCEGVRR